jgi:ATP-dependent RNA helicase DDX21
MNDKLISMGANVLHGDISQAQREKTMQGYRDGKFSCLITTNVCARGVDIPEVDLVINAEPPADVESYIHRSGRTGRAGRAGSCVTFFKAQQESLLQNITRKAGVDFTKISAPQPKDIIKARASQSIEEMKSVDDAVLPFFESAAKDLLSHFEGDFSKALQCALAMICSTTKKLPSRSLLTANDGWITLLFKTENVIRNVGYIRTMLQKSVPSLTYDDTIGWRMTADNMGVVVDVKEDKVIQNSDSSLVLAEFHWKDSKGVSLQIPKVLPELQASYGSGNGRGRSRGSGFARGGRGSTRGLRGRGRGYSR